ncbi:2-deoxystreptamine glucosyltransferase [Novipirellula aureliae]|uniref:2-deoxystreptamine glucosyltransferase n=2 Tax=Novipirellula aureliae TaxID=2527966 RepID=A0A5C6E4P2_9BACT|nr:2-deoxystreptamine glucosyltransferase [Novipirellula aureliae]
MKVVFLTAGAAGMYCGSCMHDNALARTLIADGYDCLLQPIYTPIRTDSISVASEKIFFGGIHVYLLQQMPWLRFVPQSARRFLDWPPLIRVATRKAASTDPAKLGDLAISMLQGTDGRQSEEVIRLVDWLENKIQPDVLILSNLLIGGSLPLVHRRLPETQVIVMLQGDDIFLDHLPTEARAEAIALCSKLVSSVDRFVVNSRFYADRMGTLLNIPPEKLFQTPLSIDAAAYSASLTSVPDRSHGKTKTFRIGYLARISPEKGLHRLVDAFLHLANEHHDVTLEVAGWLGEVNRPYLKTIQTRVREAGLEDRFTYHGSPELAEKVAFLQSLDLLSVPTEYEDPKGLFALEAMASGVPVVLPDHGGFSELIASTGGGILVPPNDHHALAEAILRLKNDPLLRKELSKNGHRSVHEKHSIENASRALATLFAQS